MYRSGKHELKITKANSNKIVDAAEGVPIYGYQIAEYCNNTFWDALQAWSLTKRWGLANGNVGWANEPMEYIEAITVLDSVSDAMENEAMEEAKAGKNTSSIKK